MTETYQYKPLLSVWRDKQGKEWVSTGAGELKPHGWKAHPGMVIMDAPGLELEPVEHEPTDIRDIAATMRDAGLEPDQTDERNLEALLKVTKARGLEESWMWQTLEAVGAVCGREKDGSLWVLSLEWEHLHRVHDQLIAMPIKVHSNFLPEKPPEEKKKPESVSKPEVKPRDPWFDLPMAKRDAIKAAVQAEQKIVTDYYLKHTKLTEADILGVWGAANYDFRTDWNRFCSWEYKLAEYHRSKDPKVTGTICVDIAYEWMERIRDNRVPPEAIEAYLNSIAPEDKAYVLNKIGLYLTGKDVAPADREAFEKLIVLIRGEAQVEDPKPVTSASIQPSAPNTGDGAHNQVVPDQDQSAGSGEASVLPNDQPQTQEVCDDHPPQTGGPQLGGGEQNSSSDAPALPAALDDKGREIFGADHQKELDIIIQDGVAAGITEKLLKIWWNDIRRTSENKYVRHDLLQLTGKIRNFQFAQNKFREATVDEEGNVDVSALLASFGWLEMPKLTDPDIEAKLDLIGDRIATYLDQAARYRENAEVRAQKREAAAQGYQDAFGHLLSADAESRLKRTKSGKNPGSITGGKTVTYPSFQVSFTKTGGTFFSKDKTGATLAPFFMEPEEDWTEAEKQAHAERQQALKEAGLELKVKTIYEFDTPKLWKAIDKGLITLDELDGVNRYPENECGEWKISGRKKEKQA